MAENTEKLLTIRILETPAGRDVFNAFIASLLKLWTFNGLLIELGNWPRGMVYGYPFKFLPL